MTSTTWHNAGPDNIADEDREWYCKTYGNPAARPDATARNIGLERAVLEAIADVLIDEERKREVADAGLRTRIEQQQAEIERLRARLEQLEAEKRTPTTPKPGPAAVAALVA